jgi:hypothetical protein
MASSAQLSKNNQDARIWAHWDTNTERDLRGCIVQLFDNMSNVYPELEIRHQGTVDNQEILESLGRYKPGHIATLMGTERGSSRPDGGVISVKCIDGRWRPVLIGENKHQQDNPGNALERSLKNITFFKNLMIEEDYFPYLLNINGPIVNDRKGSLFDRIRQDAGFVPANQVHVLSDPAFPRLRPFTIWIQEEFDPIEVTGVAAEIIKQSISWLRSKGLVG